MNSAPLYRLYHYWRSSSSWRVRMTLEWKDIPFEAVPVHLLNGESESEAHLKRNPAGFVPVLEILSGKDAGNFISESLAIIRYLEEVHPDKKTVFPGTPLERARQWALAEIICADTQPLQNIPVMELHTSEAAGQKRWAQHWICHGLEVFEKTCAPYAGRFSQGDTFSIADICLLPQIYNAERYEVNLEKFSCILKIAAECKQLAAYLKSHPDKYQ